MTQSRNLQTVHFVPLVFTLALGLLVGCSPGATEAASPPTTATSSAETPEKLPAEAIGITATATQDLAKRLGAQCSESPGKSECTIGNVAAGDYYDIELSPQCGDDGFFAGVSSADAALLDTLPVTGSKALTNAKLAQDQFVCLQATARSGQQPAYYYAVAISPDNVAACHDSPACSRYGQRPIERQSQPTTGNECSVVNSQWQGDCARGWISADALDIFSNGL